MRSRRNKSPYLNPVLMARDRALKALGLSEDVTDAEVRSAYRKLAMKYHPDRNPGDAAAEAKFKQLTAARDALLETAPSAPPPPPPSGSTYEHPPPVPPEWEPPRASSSVNWTKILPGLDMKTATAFVGVREDGRVDLYLKDTYQTSLASPDAAAYLIYKHVEGQLDVRLRDVEVHFIILGSQRARQWKVMALREFADKIGFRYVPNRPPHVPKEGVGPGDFE